MLLKSIRYSLDELIYLLDQLTDKEYSEVRDALNNATIGEHTRIIIEKFQCLENSYDSGILNYDKRELNELLQTETKSAKEQITELKTGLKSENKTIYLEQVINGLAIRIQSSYYRELLYNLECCNHYQALIKAVISKLGNTSMNANLEMGHSAIRI